MKPRPILHLAGSLTLLMCCTSERVAGHGTAVTKQDLQSFLPLPTTYNGYRDAHNIFFEDRDEEDLILFPRKSPVQDFTLLFCTVDNNLYSDIKILKCENILNYNRDEEMYSDSRLRFYHGQQFIIAAF